MNASLQKLKLMIAINILVLTASFSNAQTSVGLFDSQTDVGPILHPGSAVYDPSTQQYQLSGSGSNIWFNHDEFHYAWKKMKGDFILHARASLIGKGVEQHRKLGWMIRSSLDTSASMVCATVHGDGLTSLQYRKSPGTNVEEARSTISAPDVIQLERKGNQYIMSVAHFGEPFLTQQ